MMSFAIPGTVIGVSYIMAFNLPPLEMDGLGADPHSLLRFRNMPVGVRGGIAAMSHWTKAWTKPRSRSGQTASVPSGLWCCRSCAGDQGCTGLFVRPGHHIHQRGDLPLSAQYNMATSYIVGSLKTANMVFAIAYSSMLIVVMITVIAGFQLLVGERRLRRENRVAGLDDVKPVSHPQEKIA